MSSQEIKCYNCGTRLPFQAGAALSRSEDCPSCHADLRCCRMCVFYDKSSYNECREPTAERVLDKEKANFCDFFKAGSAKGGESEKEDLTARANALFKK